MTAENLWPDVASIRIPLLLNGHHILIYTNRHIKPLSRLQITSLLLMVSDIDSFESILKWNHALSFISQITL